LSNRLLARRLALTPYRGGNGGGGGGDGGLLDGFRLWGFSTSRKGLGGGSNADWLSRATTMATNAGVSVASLKAAAVYHDYNNGFSTNVSGMGSFQFVAGNGIGWILQNQKPDGSGTTLQSWASGSFDDQLQTYLENVTAWCSTHSKKAILVLHHEPENDTTSQEAQWWAQAQARWVKLVYDHDDPSVIACVNLMWDPGGSHPAASNFDFTPTLLTLCQGNATYQQQILDRTLLGLDPYPEIQNGTPGTVYNRMLDGLDFWRPLGLKHYYLPEVALFHWDKGVDPTNRNGVVLQTDVQIAQRHHDNFCVGLVGNLAGGGYNDNILHGGSYFDVSDWNNVNFRSPTREFGIGKVDANGNTVADADTAISLAPKTLAHYAQVILGTPHARPS
jgi:hypothetical protein